MLSLQTFYSPDGPERVGLILEGDEVIEVENVNEDQKTGFIVKAEEMMRSNIIGTWHTHPGRSMNLSVADYYGFLNYPHLIHYIVGVDGIARYTVKDGMVIND